MKLFSTILILLVTVFYGCNPFSPENDHFENNYSIQDSKTIEGLMSNFVFAYTFKDSFLYETLLDSAFTFEYDNNGFTETWNRDEDLRITRKMFRSFKRIGLVFNSSFPQSLADTVSFITSFNISFYYGTMEDTFSGFGRFVCCKNKASQDSVYKILYWKDLK